MNTVKSFIKSEIDTLKNDVTLPEYILWWVLRILQAGVLIRLIINDPSNGNILLLSVNLAATFLFTLLRVLFAPIKIVKKLSFRGQSWLNVMIFFGSFLAQGLNWNHEISSWDKVLHLLAGGFIVFVGNEFINVFIRDSDRISPLFRTFTAVGFSYMAIAIWEVFEFFVDYYWAGSCNQAYNISPERDAWFQAIFGLGAQNENQWAVFDTSVDILCAVVGAIPASIALLIYLVKKEKREKALTVKVEESVETEKEEVNV